MSRRLIAVGGPATGQFVVLEDHEISLGRDSRNALVLEDPAASRRHCRIGPVDGSLVLTDLASRHGTHVNGSAVDSHILVHEDRIAIGRSLFLYLDDAAAGSGALSIELGDGELSASQSAEIAPDETFLGRPERASRAHRQRTGRGDFEAVQRVSEAIGRARDPAGLAASLLELLFEVTPANLGGVMLLADNAPADSLAFDPIYARGAHVSGRCRVSRTVARRVLGERRSLLANGVEEDNDWATVESIEGSRVTAFLCVPITVFERPVGVVYLASTRAGGRFEADHLELVTAVAGIAGMPLDALRRSPPPVASSSPYGDVTIDEEVIPPAGVGALLFRPDEPLHLGTALALRAACDLIPAERFLTRALVLDYSRGGALARPPFSPALLDRLAILPPGIPVACASAVPSIAGLATVMAATLDTPSGQDGRSWFLGLLSASGLVVSGATHALIEPGTPAGDDQAWDPAGDLELARTLASRINKHTAGFCPRPSPLAAAGYEFLSLDGKGPMGPSPRGTLLFSDEPKDWVRKIRSAVTDAGSFLDPDAELSPAVRNLLLLHRAVTGMPTSHTLVRLAGKGYGTLKGELGERAAEILAYHQTRRRELAESTTLADSLRQESARLDGFGRTIADLLGRSPALLGN